MLETYVSTTMASEVLDTPTPTSLAPVLTSAQMPPTMMMMNKPKRPDSLTVRTSSQYPQLNIRQASSTMDSSISISTPSTGTFNFDSLMEGGTGLTPISGPLMPNRGPLDLVTPCSEPSKLCSL